MKRKHWLMLTALPLSLLCLAVLASDTGPSAIPTFKKPDLASETPWKVTRVIDGDTFLVSSVVGPVKVRLIGVDTPETVHPTKAVEYYGREASQFSRTF